MDPLALGTPDSNAEAIAVIIGVASSIFFGIVGYASAVFLRRRKADVATEAISAAEIARLASDAVAAKLEISMEKQFKAINDHLVLQDRVSRMLGERVARIEGRLGIGNQDDG